MPDPAKRAEWAAAWPLPFVAMLGVAGAGIFPFSSGVFMDEVSREFGWSKIQFTSALTAPLLVSLVMVPLIGQLIDRIGPRRIALFGIVPAVLGTSLLGFANGQIWQWWLLCSAQAMGCLIVVPPVWLAAVVSRFHASRGLALAVGLAGTGLGTALWPMLAAYFIGQFGWRLAYAAMAVSWGAVMLPLTFAFFHSARDQAAAKTPPAPAPGASYRRVLLSPTFLCLGASGGLMICICYGLMIHLVPILRSNGLDLASAASLAGLAGACSILGRIVTGVLLDKVSSRIFAVSVFLLPLAICLLLLTAHGSLPLLLLAVLLLGLATGAESDILTYVTSRRFDPGLFGSLYSVIQTVLAVAAISGSIIAGALYDLAGSYDLFLMVLMPMALLGALLISFVGDARRILPETAAGASLIHLDAGPGPLAMPGFAEERR